MDADLLLTPTPAGPGRFEASPPDGWLQGPGLFGGLVTGLLCRALESSAPGRPLRSLTAELFGPVQAGPLAIDVEVLREGKAVTTASARLTQEGKALAHAVAVLGAPRPATDTRVVLEAPRLPPWPEVEEAPIGPPMGPVFAPHFSYRPTAYAPFRDNREARGEGWVVARAPGRVRDAAWLAFCVDAWWPALFATLETPRPMSTVAFTLQPFAHFEGLDPEAPLQYRARVLAADEGYCVEQRELWAADGRLLALNQQTFVIIK